MSQENFGQRMVRLKQERGLSIAGPGRPARGKKYAKAITAVEQTFASALPQVAQTYLDELQAKQPEQCPDHRRVLRCPEKGCEYRSQRTSFDHRAAGYVFDRLMGRPVSRSENSIQVSFVRQVTESFAEAFLSINHLADPEERRAAFADRLAALAAAYDPNGGGY